MEAQQFTLHSLKVTMLAAAAQLRLDERAPRLQGHHKIDSVQLYSRDDTVDSIWLQTEISSHVRSGWRPLRPQARGSQQSTPEPLFHLQHKNFPSDLELPRETGLQDFQFIPDIRLQGWICRTVPARLLARRRASHRWQDAFSRRWTFWVHSCHGSCGHFWIGRENFRH